MLTIIRHVNKWKVIKKWIVIIVLVQIIFLVLSVVIGMWINRDNQEKFKLAKAGAPFDAIIVPGLPFDGQQWSPLMKIRVYWAMHLYKIGLTKNVIFSGSSVYSPYVEAEIMALYAEKLGLPRSNIFIENRAEHSTENIWFSFHLGKNLGFQHMALTTDPFQSKLLEGFSEDHLNNELFFLPMPYEKMDEYEKMLDPIIDASSKLIHPFESIIARESWWKRWQGTKGHNINYSEFEGTMN